MLCWFSGMVTNNLNWLVRFKTPSILALRLCCHRDRCKPNWRHCMCHFKRCHCTCKLKWHHYMTYAYSSVCSVNSLVWIMVYIPKTCSVKWNNLLNCYFDTKTIKNLIMNFLRFLLVLRKTYHSSRKKTLPTTKAP